MQRQVGYFDFRFDLRMTTGINLSYRRNKLRRPDLAENSLGVVRDEEPEGRRD